MTKKPSKRAGRSLRRATSPRTAGSSKCFEERKPPLPTQRYLTKRQAAYHLGIAASPSENVCRCAKGAGDWKTRAMVDRYAKFATEHLAASATRIESARSATSAASRSGAVKPILLSSRPCLVSESRRPSSRWRTPPRTSSARGAYRRDPRAGMPPRSCPSRLFFANAGRSWLRCPFQRAGFSPSL